MMDCMQDYLIYNLNEEILMDLTHIKSKIQNNLEDISQYLSSLGNSSHLPLYSSVDIRVNSSKAAVVDTNLFPAGFNNLCEYSSENIPQILKESIQSFIPNCKDILILAESHTRNKFYLDNIYSLKKFLNEAGFNVDVSAILNSDIPVQEGYITLETAKKKSLKVYQFEWLKQHLPEFHYDFVLLNNDLSKGVPSELSNLNIPIYPSYLAGWHSRNKSHHFKEVNRIMSKISEKFDIDPFFTTTSFIELPNVNINNASDRTLLYDQAKQLFESLTRKYSYYNIDQKPLAFLKANRGTYGMGVVPIESPEDILKFNRKNRNSLAKGKESRIIDSFIIQEGVPSELKVHDQVAELCLYYATKSYMGGFFRLNSNKSNRENLNSSGMSFQKICTSEHELSTFSAKEKGYDKSIIEDFSFYKFLGHVSVVAAQQEIKQLELTRS